LVKFGFPSSKKRKKKRLYFVQTGMQNQ